MSEPTAQRYFLSQDDACHWYIVEAEHEEDFNNWVEDEDDWDVPDYAREVGGSHTLVKFSYPDLRG